VALVRSDILEEYIASVIRVTTDGELETTLAVKNGVSGMLRRLALVITDVSEELSASFIRVTRIGELGTTLAGTSNRRKM
jgi:hypothetical protein